MPTFSAHWDEPASLSRRWSELDGRSFLEAIAKREIPLPPILQVLSISEGAMGDGWIEFALKPEPFMLNLAGTVHGGVLATLVDSALTCALVTRLEKGLACTTTDLQMRFFRPARVSSQRLVARAEIVHHGRSIGTTAGTIRDARGKLLVHATSSLAIAPAEQFINERGPS